MTSLLRDKDRIANSVDNLSFGMRTSAAAGTPTSTPMMAGMKMYSGKARQQEQDEKLATWLMTSGTTMKVSELGRPDCLAYLHSLDPTSRILSRDELYDYGAAAYETMKMACANEAEDILNNYTYNNPFAQGMSDGVTVHGHKILSEAVCIAPAIPSPPMMICTNTARCPDGTAEGQSKAMNDTSEDVFLQPIRKICHTQMFDGGAKSLSSALGTVEETCGLHDGSLVCKAMVGTNRTVNGKASDDFPELTVYVEKTRALGKFILRPKVWSQFEQKSQEMHETRGLRIKCWRIVLDHCTTRIGALFSMTDSVVMDYAMTKVMFGLYASQNEEYPAPDNMPENLTDAEYKVMEEVSHVMGLATPLQLFSQYEQFYTAALEVFVQCKTVEAFQDVVDGNGTAQIKDVRNVGDHSKSKIPTIARNYSDFEPIPKKLAQRGVQFAEEKFSKENVSARQKVAAFIDPRTYKLRFAENEKDDYENATRLQYRTVFKIGETHLATKRKRMFTDNGTGVAAPALKRQNSQQQFSDDDDDTDDENEEDEEGDAASTGNQTAAAPAAAPGINAGAADTWTAVLTRGSNDWTQLADAEFERVMKNWQKKVCKAKIFRTDPTILPSLPEDVVNGNVPFDALQHGLKLPMWDYFGKVEAEDKVKNRAEYGFIPVLVRQNSATRPGAGFTERTNSKLKALMDDKQGTLDEVNLRNKTCNAMSRPFVEYAKSRNPGKFSGRAWKEFKAKSDARQLELKVTSELAPDLGNNLRVMNANLEILDSNDPNPNGDPVWLVDFFIAKVTDEGIKDDYVRRYLNGKSADLYFCKWQNCTRRGDIEIVASMSDGGGIPDALFDSSKQRAESQSSAQRAALIKKWLPERGTHWRSKHTE